MKFLTMSPCEWTAAEHVTSTASSARDGEKLALLTLMREIEAQAAAVAKLREALAKQICWEFCECPSCREINALLAENAYRDIE